MARVMLNPEQYGVDYIPEVLILHMVNPLASFADQQTFMAAYQKFKFVAAIDPWLSKTADLFADVVLPAATIEKYEGPLGGHRSVHRCHSPAHTPHGAPLSVPG